MKFIANKIHWIGILLLVGFGAVAATLYFEAPRSSQPPKLAVSSTAHFACPMHPEVTSDHPGKCPKCGMALVAASLSATSAACGAEAASGDHPCCGGNDAAMTLPPGHPPVPGYTVQTICPHGATSTATNQTISPL